MTRIREIQKSRSALLVVVLAVLVGVLGLLTPIDVAQSATCARRPSLRTFYSDASHHTIVGQVGENCTCDGVDWGISSPYVTVQTFCCSAFLC